MAVEKNELEEGNKGMKGKNSFSNSKILIYLLKNQIDITSIFFLIQNYNTAICTVTGSVYYNLRHGSI